MKISIPISNKKEYSLEELSDIVRVILADADDAYFEVEELHIPREKLFEIVGTVLIHISEASLGEFELIPCSPTNYQLIYRENNAPQHRTEKEKVVSKRPSRTNPHNAAVTALRLEDITGHLPNFAKQEPYASLVADIKAKIKSE